MIDVDPLVQRLERELGLMPRGGEARRGAAARSDDTMQINVMRHLVVGMISQMKFDGVPLAHSNETSGNRAPEGPEGVTHAFRCV